MKKGFFINCVSMTEESLLSCGVMKKVYSQINVLRREFEVEHILVNTYKEKQSPLDKVKRRLPFFPVDHNWKYSSKYDGADFLYFRKSDIDYTVYRFLRDFRKHNPNAKIIFEIPTYPYYKENFHGLKDFPMFLKDVVNHSKFKKFVDRIVTYSDDSEIWGVETIVTKNGFDFSKVTLPQRNQCESINVIEVSSPAYWHGYDRFIKGMGEYYKNGGTRNIVFHMVGNGAEVANYRKLVDQYDLQDYVILYGNKFGNELADIYHKSYVGLDCLARHRSNNSTNSSLKSREYAAYGIPIISSVPIDFAPSDWQYVMNVTADDSPIDMNKVIDFYDGIYRGQSNDELAKEIRELAQSRCDMSVSMKKIVDFIEGE